MCPLADDAVAKSIPIQHFPRDLFMIGRSVMILRGLTHALGMDVKVGCPLVGHPLVGQGNSPAKNPTFEVASKHVPYTVMTA